jgi:transposase
MSQANDFENAIRQHQVHKLAGSPLLWQIMETLKIEETIDAHCPSAEKQEVPHGQAALALLLTRLLKPKALSKVEAWYAASGLDILLEHDAEKFNDDCLGNMLDAVSEQSDAIWVSVIGQALQAYPALAERVIQYDITSCYFEGAYADLELAQRGYSRDHRSDAKQVNIGLSVTGQSGLPLVYELLAGNTADNQTPFAHLAKLKTLLKQVGYPHQIVTVSDRAMLNRKLIAGYLEQGYHFLGPWTPPAVERLIASVDQGEIIANPLTFQPQSAKSSDPPSYYGVLRSITFEAHGQQASLRVLVLYSQGKARLDAQKRADHLSKLLAHLAVLEGKLNQRRRYPTARRLINWDLAGEDGALRLTVEKDDAAIVAAQALDGRYALVTNSDLSADEMLIAYKQQSTAEGRFGIIKGPIPIRPIHLRKEERIRSLVFLTMLALVVYTILEWLVRRRTPGRKRPWTGRAILEVFEEFSVVLQLFQDGSRLWLPPPLSDQQQILWNALDLPDPADFLAHLEARA